MAVAEQVADHLATLGLGTVATDIFNGEMPSEPDVCCSVQDYDGGIAPEGGIGVTGIQFEYPTVQVIFRGIPGDVAGPKVKARTAWASLAGVQPGTFQGTTYLWIKPNQSPFELKRDASDRVYIACNYTCGKEP